jgi:hypothetical protein
MLPAGIDAGVHYLLHGEVYALALVGVVGVVGNVRMKISVAGVEDIAYVNAVCRRNSRNRSQHVRETRTRYHRVLYDEMWRQPSHRTERLLPALPKPEPLCLVACNSHCARATTGAELAHHSDICLYSGSKTVELDEKNRCGVGWITRSINARLDNLNRRTIHELQSCRDDPRRDDRRCDACCVVH